MRGVRRERDSVERLTAEQRAVVRDAALETARGSQRLRATTTLRASNWASVA
jgi:hypothetical protein